MKDREEEGFRGKLGEKSEMGESEGTGNSE